MQNELAAKLEALDVDATTRPRDDGLHEIAVRTTDPTRRRCAYVSAHRGEAPAPATLPDARRFATMIAYAWANEYGLLAPLDDLADADMDAFERRLSEAYLSPVAVRD